MIDFQLIVVHTISITGQKRGTITGASRDHTPDPRQLSLVEILFARSFESRTGRNWGPEVLWRKWWYPRRSTEICIKMTSAESIAHVQYTLIGAERRNRCIAGVKTCKRRYAGWFELIAMGIESTSSSFRVV